MWSCGSFCFSHLIHFDVWLEALCSSDLGRLGRAITSVVWTVQWTLSGPALPSVMHRVVSAICKHKLHRDVKLTRGDIVSLKYQVLHFILHVTSLQNRIGYISCNVATMNSSNEQFTWDDHAALWLHVTASICCSDNITLCKLSLTEWRFIGHYDTEFICIYKILVGQKQTKHVTIVIFCLNIKRTRFGNDKIYKFYDIYRYHFTVICWQTNIPHLGEMWRFSSVYLLFCQIPLLYIFWK